MSAGLWLNNGESTVPCILQNNKPVYFKSNDKFPVSYFIDLHNKVLAHNTYNYIGARIPLEHNGLNIEVWKNKLVNYGDKELIQFLEFGWPLGLDPSVELASSLRNHPSGLQFADPVDKFITKQIAENALAGPSIICPFQGDICISPIMTVPKKPSGRRIVLDASFGESSINNATPSGVYLGQDYEFTFPKVDQFAEFIRIEGPGCLMWKKDLRNYFLQLMADPINYNVMCFAWRNMLFFFVALMFGFRNSGQAGQRTTSAVVFAFQADSEAFSGKKFKCLNYSDDLAGVERGIRAWRAYYYMSVLLAQLGLEESVEKSFPPSTCIEYLGVEFDSIAMEKRVTRSKINELNVALDEWLAKERASKRELQSILHKLLWIVNCVKHSCIFVSRIIGEMRKLSKNHHRIKLSLEIKKDFLWFKLFLETFNGVELIEQCDWSDIEDLENASDASPEYGGAFVIDEYVSAPFPASLSDEPIHIKEFWMVLVLVKLWGHRWAGKKIIVRCDNDAVCDAVFYQKPSDPKLQACVRELLYWQCRMKLSLVVMKIGTKENFVADFLSRCTDSKKIENFFIENDIPIKKRITLSDTLFSFSGKW